MKHSIILFLTAFLSMNVHAEATLRDQLQERAAQPGPPPEVKQLMQRHLDELSGSGIYDQALQVGDRAPDFELKDHTGKEHSLSSFLEDGPVILTWYRGGW